MIEQEKIIIVSAPGGKSNRSTEILSQAILWGGKIVSLVDQGLPRFAFCSAGGSVAGSSAATCPGFFPFAAALAWIQNADRSPLYSIAPTLFPQERPPVPGNGCKVPQPRSGCGTA